MSESSRQRDLKAEVGRWVVKDRCQVSGLKVDVREQKTDIQLNINLIYTNTSNPTYWAFVESV